METVIPSVGRAVRIVNGAYRGHRGALRGINTDEYCVDVEVSGGWKGI